MQEQGEGERAQDAERHRERNVDERIAERLPEDLVVDQLLEVVEPDPLRRQDQVVFEEREAERDAARHEHQRYEAEEVGASIAHEPNRRT